ncbi:MAG TPA: DEAD/DEAH box helicase [Terricaulis sp.]|nr:DEAD/DEAH box helicase [Terricaulis sp.]
MSAFENIVPALARALVKRGFETLTPVQAAVIAPQVQDEDLLVSAQTGSGKTVAFGLTLASNILGERDAFAAASAPLALIIAPTRELAVQVRGELEWLFAPSGGRIVSCVGGMDMRDERRALKQGAHIVVGTPGRLVDHIRRGSLEMHALGVVVLDEADEMLNLGFREELEFILEASPPERRTLMFSATMPRAIEALAKTYQRDARRINTIGAQRQHADIAYRALVAAGHDAENAIFNVLRYYDATNAIVFCSTRAAVTRLASRFQNRGLSVVALSGELSQSARTHALQAMRDHRAQVCVATDVAARGIDLPDLELVVHADLPKNTEALLHRSGRTGRAGRKGASVLIVPYSARRRTERLLRDSGIQAQWGEPPSADDIKRRDDQRLLGDPLLQAPPGAGEREIIAALLEKHDVAHIAAAFVRLHRKGQAAPEELAPTQDIPNMLAQAERDVRARRQENFTGGAWISLSIGHAKQAEPRWLIPMLCKAGGISKRQLGAIQIGMHETFVEIDAASIDAFMARIGEGGRIEKGVHVTRLARAPEPANMRPPRAAPPPEPKRGKPRPPPKHAKGKPAGAKLAGAPKKRKWHPAD